MSFFQQIFDIVNLFTGKSLYYVMKSFHFVEAINDDRINFPVEISIYFNAIM